MTVVDNISNWIQNVLKTSKSYSNSFYYDGHGVISNYEKAIEVQKNAVKIIEGRREILEKIHKKRLEVPFFKHVYEDINMLEMEKFQLELRVAKEELANEKDHLIILKNLVGLSKIIDMLMQELPENSKVKKELEKNKRFRLYYEETLDMMKQVLDKKLSDADKQNRSLK